MSEENMKELLKGKSMNELLDLIMLGLEHQDKKKSIINTFKDINRNTEIA
ncbi:MAG: hypothetical protein ACRCZO_08135 [Cetobacterium sp.]